MVPNFQQSHGVPFAFVQEPGRLGRSWEADPADGPNDE